MSTLELPRAPRPHLATSPLVIGLIACCFACTSFVIAAQARGILNAAPLNGGDEDSYERLGCNLAAGLGFGYCPTDAPIVAGAEEPPAGDCRDCNCTDAEFAPTAYRPPGFPVLVAAVYRISPLNFAAVRVINLVCCGIAVGLSAAWFGSRSSAATGLLAGVLCSIDPRMREFAGTFLTENLATLLLTVFVLLFVRFLERRSVASAVVAGIAFSMLVLVRSFYVAWYPFLGLLILVVGIWTMRQSSGGWPKFAACTIAFVLASCVLTTPWWIRNCRVLDAFMPTGTQGGIGIADGFSDQAVANFGSWTSATADAIAADMRSDSTLATLSPIEFEREHARRGAASARRWIREHSDQLLSLSWWKLSRLWELGSVAHGMLFGVMILGLIVSRDRTTCRVLIVLLVFNSITVVATYHTYERFLLPFRPIIHGFVATGLIASLTEFSRRVRQRRPMPLDSATQ